MKLYKIRVESEIYVMADYEDDAYDIADENFSDAVCDCGVQIRYGDAEEISSINQVDCDWRNALPFTQCGENQSEYTIRELCEATAAPEVGGHDE